MLVVVFTGPTLPARLGREILPFATFLGPAECGDLYKACRLQPRAIVLIDGYFDHRLAVWHKEILWALTRGVEVYGAGSMGAIRAAELDGYGMVGSGVVYEQFRSGEIEDDDEVAVLHESEDREYRPQSDAMVNIRATLRAALAAGVIDSGTEAELIAAAKSTFYADRRLSRLLESTSGISEVHRQQLNGWFRARGPVEQKRADAVALLRFLVGNLQDDVPKSGCKSSFAFSKTNYFCALQQRLEQAVTAISQAPSVAPLRTHAVADAPPSERAMAVEHALEEIRGSSRERFIELEREAFERALALLLAEQGGFVPSADEVQVASERIRREHGLWTPEETRRWLIRNHLDLSGFTDLARDEAFVERFRDAARGAARARMPDVLRRAGVFSALKQPGEP